MTDDHEAAFNVLRVQGELLYAALHAEGVAHDVASRIWNRFFFGNGAGVEMPFHHEPRAQVLVMNWTPTDPEPAEKAFTPVPTELLDGGRPLLYDPDHAMGGQHGHAE